MAPLGRFRADAGRVPTELMAEYYAQRASTPGTLLIAEATSIAPYSNGYQHVPEVSTSEQLAGWERVRPTFCSIIYTY